jgi:uncharacterized membrane protein YeaQ/YmgE (transglycosylase-associated protein family)
MTATVLLFSLAAGPFAGNSLIILLVVGAIAGWLAGLVMKGGGFGLVGDIIIGIIGAFLGAWLFSRLGVSAGGGTSGLLITAFIGAIVLILLIRLVKRA